MSNPFIDTSAPHLLPDLSQVLPAEVGRVSGTGRHAPDGSGDRGVMRRVVGVFGDLLLVVGAVLGVICIVAAAAAFFFGVRIVLFGSGSMTPTIPQGAAAIVVRTPATDISVGDIVTIDRADALPVTHRVVAVEEIPNAPEARRLTLRGDANAVDDPRPYDVTTVGRVIVAVPGMATVVAAVSTAPALLAATLVAAGLVLWAFWPRKQEP